jgi:large subunit ribosomal protein L21
MTDPQDQPDAEVGASDVVPEGDVGGDETLAGDEVTEPVIAAPTAPEVEAPPQAEIEAEAAPGAEVPPVKRRQPARQKIKAAVPARPVTPYAVIETGGKQYRVSVGDNLSVERLVVDAGSDVTIDRVLLLGGNGATRVGTPVVAGATVTARVDDHFRGEKIVVFKYKAKKRYRRRMGHRQSLTRLTVTGIVA